MVDIVSVVSNSISNINWNSVLEVVVASPALSALSLGTVKLFKAQKDVFKIFLVFLGGCLFAGVRYIIMAPADSYPTVVAMQGLILTTTSMPFYHMFFKPLAKKFTEMVAKAAAFDAEVESAKVEDTGL